MQDSHNVRITRIGNITALPKYGTDTIVIRVSDPYGLVAYDSMVCNIVGWKRTYSFIDSMTTASFPSYKVGFASGAKRPLGLEGAVYKTYNHGESWSKIDSSGFSLSDIRFVDENFGCVVGKGYSVSRTAWKRGIKYTTDGGTTWKEPADIVPGTTSRADLNAVDFSDTKNGWAIGSINNNNLDIQILFTDNGAVNWGDVAPTGFSGKNLYCLHAFSGQSVIAGGASGTLLLTEDKGAKWNVINAGILADIRCMYFLNSSLGWLGTNSPLGNAAGYNVFMTRDGGKTWKEIALVTGNITSIHFVTDSIGWLISDFGTATYRTIDGGATWEKTTNTNQNQGRDIAGFGKYDAIQIEYSGAQKYAVQPMPLQ
jgi:photosystem II stability/assembly factor-like uncharacterized protein